METISGLAGTASKAIWGEGNANKTLAGSGQEPVSGQQGAGTINEPYDKGNEETPATNGTTTNGIGPSSAQKSDSIGDPSSGQQTAEKNQGADNPQKVPTGDDGKPRMPRTDSEREALVNSGSEFPRDPNDHSGEPMKVHAGGADDTTKDDTALSAENKGKTDRSKSVSQEGGNPHGKTLGTGEQVVKVSGVAAEGGDFDATKPGAGQEATRLLEEKGIKTNTDDASSTPSKSSDKTKVSKMDKLKQKLKIGSGKNLDA